MSTRLVVATYNIQRGWGVDFARRLDRTARVLAGIPADLIGLQEVIREPNGKRGDQAAELGKRLGLHHAFVAARPRGRGEYGSALLTRLPIEDVRRCDLSVTGREERIALRADVRTPEGIVHVFVCHLGLRRSERALQAAMLRQFVREAPGRSIVLGDFNEPFLGAVSRTLNAELGCVRGPRTHPAPLPLWSLDRIWCHGSVTNLATYKSALARVASDHLPLVATVEIAT